MIIKSIRFTKELWEQISATAKQKGTTTSSLIRMILIEWLEKN